MVHLQTVRRLIPLYNVSIDTEYPSVTSTLARAKQLEAEERANIRGPTSNNRPTTGSPDGFVDDPNATSASNIRVRDEEEAVGFDDDVALDIDDDHVVLDPGYHDFTDNESDIFADGDGDDKDETYKLHRHVDSR